VSQSLEELLRSAGQAGRIDILSVYGKRADGLYQANFKRAGHPGWAVEQHADPVEALRRVLLAAQPADNGAKSAKSDEDIFG
jgi:hypothetical protein